MDFPDKLVLPPLPFEFSALEPVISRETMEAHYLGHHQGYVEKYNILIEENGPLSDLQFNYNGHLLHTLYWNNIKPGGANSPVGTLKNKLKQQLGNNYEGILKARIIDQCLKIKGSGWTILAFEPPTNKLTVRNIPNHNFEEIGNLIPLILIDGWEHNFRDYFNNRGMFIADFYKYLNWDTADIRYSGFEK